MHALAVHRIKINRFAKYRFISTSNARIPFQIGQPLVELITERMTMYYHFCSVLSHRRGRNSLHGRGPFNVSQSILHLHLGNRGQSPPSFCFTGTPYHTRTQDTLLRAKKLPCLRARWCGTPCPMTLYITELTLERFKTGLKTHLFRDDICQNNAHSTYVTWLRGRLNRCVVHLHLEYWKLNHG